MPQTAMRSLAIAAGEGKTFSAGPSSVTVKVGAQATGGALSVLEYEAAPRGPGLHTHPSFDECFYVLKGRCRFCLGADTVDCGEGGFVFASGEEPHGFANPFDEPVTLLIVCQPGGFERFVEEVADAAAQGRIADPEFMPGLWKRYGMAPAQ